MATSSTTNAISALGAGSGMDVKALATSLVDAERVPRKDIIDKKIAKSEAAISGYSALKFVLDAVNTSLTDLKDQSDFASIAVRNSQESALTVTASATASAGSHSVQITSLASARRWLTDGYASSSTSLNGGAAFTLNLSNASGANQPITVDAGRDSPGGIVAAINAANLGVKAQLINTGESTNPFKIMVTGATGAANDFTLAAGPDLTGAALSFSTSLQTAANADVTVDGMHLTPSTNQLTDLIPGVTLNLYAPTNGPAAVDLTRNTADVKTKVTALVKAYNDANTMFNTVSDPKSTVATYGATLPNNSVVDNLRTQLREILFKDSTTPSGKAKGLRDLGVSLDKSGVMTLDNTKLDSALSDGFEDTVTMLTGNSEGLSAYSAAPSGAIGHAFKSITALLSTTGTLSTQSTNQTKRISDYKDELTKLEARMTQLMTRYNQQFGAMEGIVGQTKSLQTSLTSTFAGMMASYTKG
jgi:flagellar hook-associated protein 2